MISMTLRKLRQMLLSDDGIFVSDFERKLKKGQTIVRFDVREKVWVASGNKLLHVRFHLPPELFSQSTSQKKYKYQEEHQYKPYYNRPSGIGNGYNGFIFFNKNNVTIKAAHKIGR